jgi:diguanylate cyclase (GGDEF)-like protein
MREPVNFSVDDHNLDVLQQQMPAAIVMDYRLPDMDGLSLLGEVGAVAPKVPVVFVTGEGSEEVAVRAMKLGAADYVVKEGKYYETLPHLVEMALEQFRQREEADRTPPFSERLQNPLLYDEPTGLFSHDAFLALVAPVVGEAVRRHAELGLLLLRLDRRQAAGSDEASDKRLLAVVAGALRRQARRSDIAACYDSRTLVVLAQATDDGGAVAIARRIQAVLPDRLSSGETDEPFSISAGIAMFPRDGTDLPQLLERAEGALAVAAVAGGNCCLLAGAEPSPSPEQVEPANSFRVGDESLARRRREVLARLAQEYDQQHVEGVAVRTQLGACAVCADAARDIYVPRMAPPLPLVGCTSSGGCRCMYGSPAADARRRPPPAPAQGYESLDIPRKWRDAALFGSAPKASCKASDLADYLDQLPLLPFDVDFPLQPGEVAYLLRPVRRCWERPTARSASTHGPSLPMQSPRGAWLKSTSKPPFLPGDAIPFREEGTLCLTNWRMLFFQKRGGMDSVLLVDISDVEWLRDGIACTVGNRPNRLVFLLSDSLQTGLYVARALRDISAYMSAGAA